MRPPRHSTRSAVASPADPLASLIRNLDSTLLFDSIDAGQKPIRTSIFLLAALLLAALLLAGCAEKEPLFQATLDDNGNISVPSTLEEALLELDRGLSDHAKKLLAKDSSRLSRKEHELISLSLGHHGLGMWMRNSWGLWQGSELASHFNDLGVHHPDDMSGIIFGAYVAKLRGERFDLKERVEYYQLYWARSKPPEAWVDERTGHTIDVVAFEVRYHLADGRIVHLGEDTVTRATWFHTYERGWHEPTTDELREVSALSQGTEQRLN